MSIGRPLKKWLNNLEGTAGRNLLKLAQDRRACKKIRTGLCSTAGKE